MDCKTEATVMRAKARFAIQTIGGNQMLNFMRYGRWMSCVAAFAMLAAPVSAAEGTRRSKEQVFDIKLSKNGTLVGQVLTSSGQAQAKSDVVAVSQRQVVSRATTNAQGVFQLLLPKAGVYRIAMQDRSFTIRAWQGELAPPAARSSLLCVAQDVTVRGQCGCGAPGPCDCGVPACGPCDPCGAGVFGGGGGGLTSILTNPVVIGLGVATAIALPIALDDDDDAS